ncbi:putative coproporphyrinogen oxidase [Seiridium unicorne]|uniref:coproporphyrinogen oxidase n=1 Tax=Seiridium unicorne TaxID=138068 RepID=A0ABR2UPA5_9PEZI
MVELQHSPLHAKMVQLVKEQQRNIVSKLEEAEGQKFKVDEWTRENGGYGITCMIEDGNVFERGGVLISIVHGKMSGGAVAAMRANHASIGSEIDSLNYSATGLSLILHPKNPLAPTVHANCRFLETFDSEGKLTACWFGGGADLTPVYIFDEDARYFHSSIKEVCDKYDNSYYPRFKEWCDQYFWNTHRNEARGIGGIFFDDLEGNGSEAELDKLFLFVRDFLSSFPSFYVPIVQKRKELPFTEAQKEWQQIRRGRYVEFNLLHDRGTKFGLGGSTPRVESILISMPLTAAWRYYHEPAEGSKEQELIKVLQTPKQWI